MRTFRVRAEEWDDDSNSYWDEYLLITIDGNGKIIEVDVEADD